MVRYAAISVPAETSICSAQKIFQLCIVVELYANPIGQLPVGYCETMLGYPTRRGFVHDQLVASPAAMSWLRWISNRVEEPPEDRRMGTGRRQVITVDHEDPVSAKLCTVGPHLPVVLHDNPITDIQFEDDHRPRRGCRSPRRRRLLLDARPVAQHRKEEFAEIHAPILSRASGGGAMPAPSLTLIHPPEVFLLFGPRSHLMGWLPPNDPERDWVKQNVGAGSWARNTTHFVV